MTIRAKFQLVEITEYAWGQGKRLKFIANYDPTIPEDQRFAKATPTGEFTMHVDNPVALAELVNGESYYFDIHPVRRALPALDPNEVGRAGDVGTVAKSAE